MSVETQLETPVPLGHRLRTPAEPSPAPIKEPPNNLDAPVREPDPDDPAQI